MSSPTNSLPDSEILALLDELLTGGEIGLYPERNDNGADHYVCQCCCASTPIKGHAYGTEPLDAHPHTPDCKLMKLASAMQARRNALETAADAQ